jgi:hypothetical protein
LPLAGPGPMIEVVVRPWAGQSLHDDRYDDLPAYLTEPAPAERRPSHLRDGIARALQRSATRSDSPNGTSVPFGERTPGQSPVFARMVPLRGDRLTGALDAWWAAQAKGGVVTVQRRLQLGLPQGDIGSGWRLTGRLRRLTTFHWVPVVVELWPMYKDFTTMTMTPQAHVLPSKRYFRLGHAVLDRLWADLAGLADHIEVDRSSGPTPGCR